MGKISPVSAKYIVQANIDIDGVVDRPDVIGAIFGQTEGLLGADLELRELQRSGRIGRIEVNVDTKTGKTVGKIIIPSSLDKAETAIVGAALEIIQRIGPCNAKIRVENIEDVRVSKRQFVIERAKELLKNLMETSIPDSQELADEVAYSVRVMEITEFGEDRLPAGPQIDESDEIVIVEGRADVINLLKHGIKNSIAINGTSVPQTIVELAKKKIVTVFVDGDRGGDLIIKELLNLTEIDYITKAPDGKEVEELTKKEIHKCLRSRVGPEQAKVEPKSEFGNNQQREERRSEKPSRPQMSQPSFVQSKPSQAQAPLPSFQQRPQTPQAQAPIKRTSNANAQKPTNDEKKRFGRLLEDLIGTRGAYILDTKLNILGKVPLSELTTTLASLSSGIYAVVFDGECDNAIISAAEKSDVKFLVAMGAKSKSSSNVCVLTVEDFS
ncbi:DNA primase [Candidatus Woesearchaeota archaeon]|nr:DNA primase [Candidatus Woesearchaeota archaeon]